MIRDINGYEGYYTISDTGVIMSLISGEKHGVIFRRKKPRAVKCQIKKDGYVVVILTKDRVRKTHMLHRLIATAFIDNPHNYPEINHKDENKLNNTISNLEWCTSSYNTNYGTGNQRRRKAELNNKNSSLSVIQCDMNMNVIKEYPSMAEAERQTGIFVSQISKCVHKKKGFDSAGGYKWILNT